MLASERYSYNIGFEWEKENDGDQGGAGDANAKFAGLNEGWGVGGFRRESRK